jgi:hypothetical protein
MSISRVLARLLLVPLASVLAGCAATLVAFFANWNVFLSVIGGDAMTSGDVVAIMVGLAMLLVGSAATFPMLLPAVIGVTISEALALRSVVFHTLNGVVSIWVGRNSMAVPGRPFEFHDHPPAVLAAGLAAGLVYWLIAGRSAGLAPEAPRPQARPVSPSVPKSVPKTPSIPNPR